MTGLILPWSAGMLNGGGSPKPILISTSSYTRGSGFSTLSYTESVPSDCTFMATAWYCRYGGPGSSAGSGTVTGTLAGTTYSQQTGFLANSRVYVIMFVRNAPATGSSSFSFSSTRAWSGAGAVNFYFKNTNPTTPVAFANTASHTGTQSANLTYTNTNKTVVLFNTTYSSSGSRTSTIPAEPDLAEIVTLAHATDDQFTAWHPEPTVGVSQSYRCTCSTTPSTVGNSSILAVQGP